MAKMASRFSGISTTKQVLGILTFVEFVLAQVNNRDVTHKAEEQLEKAHRISSLGLLMFMTLLILTILTIWLIKHFRLRYIHETGLSIIYGLVAGVLIKYTTVFGERDVITVNNEGNITGEFDLYIINRNKTFSCHLQSRPMDQLESYVSFEPEIFFYVILPPIIFNAGFSMKRRHFFKNFGAIIVYAFLGTLLSAFCTGGVLYGIVKLIPSLNGPDDQTSIYFQDCLWYGSIISATDPVTVLAIFNDLHVDVNLYAIVFGESVLNDAVAIVLAQAVESYKDGVEEIFRSIGMFLAVFVGSFAIGLAIGCTNALMTKFTKIREFPMLESCLLLLMSYSSYLCAEAASLSGIVAVLFCGIFQAHYTFNNLSKESQTRTKEVLEIMNFIAENFVFAYIGLTIFTRNFEASDWNPGFMFGALFSITVARAVNIYPLTLLLNLGRKNKISFRFQHMMMFSGLRGAIAFALAIREASTGVKKYDIFLTTTIFLVILTVIGCGALTLPMLQWLKISVGVDDSIDVQQLDSINDASSAVSNVRTAGRDVRVDKAKVVKIWNKLDHFLLKPILTNYRVTLADNFPENRCCGFLSRCFTTVQQFENRANTSKEENDSDADIIIEDDQLTMTVSDANLQTRMFTIEDDPGDLGVPLHRSSPTLAFM